MNSQRLAECKDLHGSAPDGVLELGGKGTHAPISTQKQCPVDSYYKWNFSFLQGSLTGETHYYKDGLHIQHRQPTENEFCGLIGDSLSYKAGLSILLCFFLILLYFSFIYVFSLFFSLQVFCINLRAAECVSEWISVPHCFMCLCLVSFPSVCLCSRLFCFILFHYYPLEHYFLMTDRKGVDSGGRSGQELEGVGRQETMIRIYYTNKKNKFNKTKIK